DPEIRARRRDYAREDVEARLVGPEEMRARRRQEHSHPIRLGRRVRCDDVAGECEKDDDQDDDERGGAERLAAQEVAHIRAAPPCRKGRSGLRRRSHFAYRIRGSITEYRKSMIRLRASENRAATSTKPWTAW